MSGKLLSHHSMNIYHYKKKKNNFHKIVVVKIAI